MDAQTFLAEFAHIANAPGGIGKLRELAIQLAISGRLTQQSVSDTPADQLISKNLALQQTLILQKKLKKQPDPAVIKKSEEPWLLPRGWVWTRLGVVTNYGDAPKVEFDDVSPETWVLELEDIEKYSSRLLARVLAKDREFKSTKNKFRSGAVLYGKLRPYLNKVLIAESDGVCTTEIMPITYFDQIDPNYLRYYLKSRYFIDYASGSAYGMNLPRMSTDSAREALFPFPPKEEQSLIFAKVDELMALCDKLEAQQQARRNLQDVLRQSTLQAITASEDPSDLKSAWARLAENFALLIRDPSDVDQCAAELMGMAVRGWLSSPSTSAVRIDEIISACEAMRAGYIKSNVMRRQKLVAAAEHHVVYPGHWSVVSFDQVAVVIGGVTKGRDMRGRDLVTCPYLSVANVQRGFFKLQGLKTIQIAVDELQKYVVEIDDLLITEGGDWDKVGRTAIWRGGAENCLHQNHVFKARIPSDQLLNEWVELVFNSGVGRDYFAGASKQTTNLASINMTQLRSFPLPIPPLDEQREILDALARLTSMFNELRKKFDRKETLASMFAAASIEEMTGITIDSKEDIPVKVPQTELVSPLRLGKLPGVKAQAPLATILARHKGEMSAKDLWQRFSGEIDVFYAQLKTEIGHGWILEPGVAEMREKATEDAGA
jgi:type I restriction enzyme S subunit